MYNYTYVAIVLALLFTAWALLRKEKRKLELPVKRVLGTGNEYLTPGLAMPMSLAGLTMIGASVHQDNLKRKHRERIMRQQNSTSPGTYPPSNDNFLTGLLVGEMLSSHHESSPAPTPDFSGGGGSFSGAGASSSWSDSSSSSSFDSSSSCDSSSSSDSSCSSSGD